MTKEEGKVPVGRFIKWMASLFTIMLCFNIIISLMAYWAGSSEGKIKQEVKDKAIELQELKQDEKIKNKGYKLLPDTNDPDYWNKLRRLIPKDV